MFDKFKISTRLFLITALSAVLPIVIVAIVVGIFFSQAIDRLTADVQKSRSQIAADIVGVNLKDKGQVIVDQIDTYISERIKQVSGWAANPMIRQAAAEGSALAVQMGLPDLTEQQNEERMNSTRALSTDPQIFNYLKDQLKLNPAFSELFFTDDHGFAVAHNAMTSDFVQKGEGWWDQAWSAGSYMGPVSYDESSGVYSVEIAVRITDEAGKPLGVIKAVLDVQAVQKVGKDAISRITQGTVRIAASDGSLISDTASNNDPALIMKDSGNLLKRKWAAFQQIIDKNQQSGFLLDQTSLDGAPVIVGYARTAYGAYYDLPGFEGLNWLVVVEQPSRVALGPLDSMNEEMNNLVNTRGSILWLFIILSVVSLAVSMIFAYLVTRGITGPINALAEAGQRFSSGDLDVTVDVRHKNEIGILENTFQQMVVRLRAMLLNERNEREYMENTVQEYLEFLHGVSAGNLTSRLALDGSQRSTDDPLVRLGSDLNQVTESLHQMILQVQDTASQLAAASTEILSATTQQASGASEQSAAISQTTTTVEEVKNIAEVSAMRAREVADSAQETVHTSQAGRDSVEATIESMAQIKERVERIAENILALSEQMQQIGEIISTVNTIASQSNMLALNASVEAARAGEHGRGFAVVAAEVRSLAEQSKEATEQIKVILQDIQKATNSTVMATEEGTKGVEQGVRLAYQAKSAIESLSMVIDQSAQNAKQMVASGQQQTAGVEQVALAMNNINQATMQSLASTRQAEKAAQDLHELALRMTETITRYQV